MNKIGKIIKDQRLEKNITLKSLSDSTSISIGTLSNIENDKIKNPSGVFLYRISKVLDIDYNYLVRQRWDILPIFSFERKRT